MAGSKAKRLTAASAALLKQRLVVSATAGRVTRPKRETANSTVTTSSAAAPVSQRDG